MRLLGYTRVSTSEQTSTSAQERSLRKYCEALDHTLVDVFTDVGSGREMSRRQGLQALLTRLENADIDGVIVVKIDRLSRSMRDWPRLIEKYFQPTGMGKELIALDWNIDTSTATGRMFLNMMITLSQWEREIISERILEKFSEMRTRGDYGMRFGRIPYGFTASEKTNLLRPHPGELIRVYCMKQLRKEGLGHRRIARWLNEHKWPGRLGKIWKFSNIARITSSPTFQKIEVPGDFDCHALPPGRRQAKCDIVKQHVLAAFDRGEYDQWIDEGMDLVEDHLDEGLQSIQSGTGHVAELEMLHEDVVALWIFPAGDWQRWVDLTGGHDVAGHEDYLRIINHMDFEYRERGFRVIRTELRVNFLIKKMKAAGIENNSNNRAAFLSLEAGKQLEDNIEHAERLSHRPELSSSQPVELSSENNDNPDFNLLPPENAHI